MHTLLATLAVADFSTGGLLHILFFVAIAAIVIWAVIALINWSGIAIPPPVRIIGIALVCIVLIILMFKMVGIAL